MPWAHGPKMPYGPLTFNHFANCNTFEQVSVTTYNLQVTTSCYLLQTATLPNQPTAVKALLILLFYRVFTCSVVVEQLDLNVKLLIASR